MANKKKKLKPSPVVGVTVHADAVNPTAFRLGFYHGTEGVPARKRDTFCYQSTATSYSLGYVAGCAARAKANV